MYFRLVATLFCQSIELNNAMQINMVYMLYLVLYVSTYTSSLHSCIHFSYWQISSCVVVTLAWPRLLPSRCRHKTPCTRKLDYTSPRPLMRLTPITNATGTLCKLFWFWLTEMWFCCMVIQGGGWSILMCMVSIDADGGVMYKCEGDSSRQSPMAK